MTNAKAAFSPVPETLALGVITMVYRSRLGLERGGTVEGQLEEMILVVDIFNGNAIAFKTGLSFIILSTGMGVDMIPVLGVVITGSIPPPPPQRTCIVGVDGLEATENGATDTDT